MSTFWTCRAKREVRGVKIVCKIRNPGRKQKCVRCGAPRPRRRQAKHLLALEAPYESYIALNGGERCGICLSERTAGRKRLDRDHDHRTGRPRGLLCHRCNRALAHWITAEWCDAAAAYLRAAA